VADQADRWPRGAILRPRQAAAPSLAEVKPVNDCSFNSSAVADGDDKHPETAEPGPIEETTAAPETTGLVSGGADAGLDVSMAEVKPVNDCSFNNQNGRNRCRQPLCEPQLDHLLAPLASGAARTRRKPLLG
jgi:hypothetical protein